MLSLLAALMLGTAHANDISATETTYDGAVILSGDYDVTFASATNGNYESDPNVYAYFEGNTLYAGNEDEHRNTIDAIVEFFWFESSINRASDFYVAVIKVRANPNENAQGVFTDCELWTNGWGDFGDAPVVSVEAFTDTSREQGAFRWDWASPFEDYGIDAYSQITFQNSYGIGANAEGSAMTGLSIPEDTNINGMPVQGDANVQVKGYVNPSYKVQTQYDVTLWEWDVFVHGTPAIMAWDMYLNLDARADRAAYQEYFLPIQVEIGEPFMMDELTFATNFDTSDFNPFPQEVAVSLQNLVISLPYYEPEETIDEPSDEPEEEIIDTQEDTGTEDLEDTGVILDANEDNIDDTNLVTEPISSCSTFSASSSILMVFASWLIVISDKRKWS